MNDAQHLARDTDLVRSLIAAAGEPQPGPGSREFLRDVLRSAGHTDDLDLLEHGNIRRAPATSIFGLFGVDLVDHASAVMIGNGNKLTTDMEVARGTLKPGSILSDLGQVRTEAALIRAALSEPKLTTAADDDPDPRRWPSFPFSPA